MIDINTPIGTKCRIIAPVGDLFNYNGNEVIIVRNDRSDWRPFKVQSTTSSDTCWCSLHNLELIESPSPLTNLFSYNKLLSQH